MKSADIPIEDIDQALEEADAKLIRVEKQVIDYVAVVLRIGTTCLFMTASIFLHLDNFDWISAGSLFLSGMITYCLAVGIEVYKQYISPVSNIGLFSGFISMCSLVILFTGGLVMRENHGYSLKPSLPYLWIGGTSLLFISQIVKGFVSFEHGPLKSLSFGSAAVGTLCFLIASLLLINDFFVDKEDILVISILLMIGSTFYFIHSILFLSATLFYEFYYDEGNISTEVDEDVSFVERLNCIVRITFSILLIAGSICLHPNARSSRGRAASLLISGFTFFLIAVSVEVYKNRGRGSLMVGAHINSFVAIIFLLFGSILLLLYLPHDPNGIDSEVTPQADEICSIWIAGSLLLFVALLVESTAILQDDPGQSGVRSGGSIAFTSLGALFYTIAFGFAHGDLKKYGFTESIERNAGWLIAAGIFYFFHSFLYVLSFIAN